MRSRWITWGLLMGVFALGTGASTEGIQQAQDWQHAGDIARAREQWDAAYIFYAKVAEVFPDTAHGRVAARRVRQMRAQMVSPARSPGSDDPLAWIGELVDFLLWP
ncbi:MAG: hypothetical protein HYZ95_02675 [Candidatus Omnitrophica bacterium]|nr:hypothetical protein [Candidatus Omnitrophota bacterium]